MQYQTDATGPGAIPLSYLMSYLAGSVSTEQEGFYSAHVTMGTASQGQSAVGIATVARASDGRTLNRMFYDWHINLPNVWEAMLAQPLDEIEYEDLDNSKSNLHVLHLWGRAMAHLTRDWLGNEQLGLLLSELRTRYEGTNYTYTDLVAVANDIGIDITPIFGDWLTNTQLQDFAPVTREPFDCPIRSMAYPYTKAVSILKTQNLYRV